MMRRREKRPLFKTLNLFDFIYKLDIKSVTWEEILFSQGNGKLSRRLRVIRSKTSILWFSLEKQFSLISFAELHRI